MLKSGDGGHTSSDQLKKKKQTIKHLSSKYAQHVSGDLMKGLSAVRVDNYGENCIIIASTFISSHLLINIALCTLFLLSTNLKG